MSMTNKYGDEFSVGDRVRWSETQQERSGTIRKLSPEDHTALILDGPFETAHVDINSLYF